jgi:hypothetical protein
MISRRYASDPDGQITRRECAMTKTKPARPARLLTARELAQLHGGVRTAPITVSSGPVLADANQVYTDPA